MWSISWGKKKLRKIPPGGVLRRTPREIDPWSYDIRFVQSFTSTHFLYSKESFLKDAAKECKTYMAKDPENINFTVLALTGGGEVV